MELQPEVPFELDAEMYLKNICSAPRGSAAGMAGDTNEHLKVLLDDEGTSELLADAAAQLARANVPLSIAKALALGSMTALLKDTRNIRGIVVGDTFRRGAGRTIAQSLMNHCINHSLDQSIIYQ